MTGLRLWNGIVSTISGRIMSEEKADTDAAGDFSPKFLMMRGGTTAAPMLGTAALHTTRHARDRRLTSGQAFQANA